MQTLPPDRVVVRARSLAKRGNQDAARDLLIDAAKRFPQNKKLRKALVLLDMPKVGPRPGGLDEKVKHLGILCRQGEHRAAIKLASQLLELHPGDPIVMTLLAAAYVASEKPAEALPIFELVIRQAPTFARAWTGFGTALAKTNRHHQAVRALNQSLSLSPLDVEALNNLGTSLRELNQHEEALSCFERIIELEDSYKARLNLGTTLLELGRAEESEAALRLAIAEKPDYTFAHRCLTLVRKYTADDPHLAQMEALNNAPDATRET
ncbi:MAG: tetratricopeptide repeat protein, partial [Pseudomonadota bacterium]